MYYYKHMGRQKHLESGNIDSGLYSIYRDDERDILTRGMEDQEAYQNHLDSIHPNLKWNLTCTTEGGYLDLLLMIKDGKV